MKQLSGNTMRFLPALVLLGGSVLLISASKPAFSPHEKAFYASPSAINFVRPGLVTKILSADIAADGTIHARFRITDPQGLPLDRTGVDTPGVVATSFVAATIPAGQAQYVSYTTRVQTSPITNDSATQAGSDTNGVYVKMADGEYQYTFGTKAPSTTDRGATHTIGVYSSRNLSIFDLGTHFADNVFNFVPNGSPVTVTRDVVRTASCNQCHDPLFAHGGSRKSVELCVMCHTSQTTDPDTGNTVNMPVMIHKISYGFRIAERQSGRKISNHRECPIDQ
jgi:OmcA/MtrC family decaheme c-type cytochrome